MSPVALSPALASDVGCGVSAIVPNADCDWRATPAPAETSDPSAKSNRSAGPRGTNDAYAVSRVSGTRAVSSACACRRVHIHTIKIPMTHFLHHMLRKDSDITTRLA